MVNLVARGCGLGYRGRTRTLCNMIDFQSRTRKFDELQDINACKIVSCSWIKRSPMSNSRKDLSEMRE